MSEPFTRVRRNNTRLPLKMALDFGKLPSLRAVFEQVSPLGQVRFLGGISRGRIYLDDFIGIVLHHRQAWFPNPCEIRECCDPAGSSRHEPGHARCPQDPARQGYSSALCGRQ